MWYTLPSPLPDFSALICAVSVPTPVPSGDVLPLPSPLTSSSWKMLSIVIVISSPFGSVTASIHYNQEPYLLKLGLAELVQVPLHQAD